VLKIHARVWKSSRCIPANLLSSYPAWEIVIESWLPFLLTLVLSCVYIIHSWWEYILETDIQWHEFVLSTSQCMFHGKLDFPFRGN
jgi:hypothetical protein